MSSWILALKEYNSKKDAWCMPRKGTAEHAEVKAIMDRMKGSKTEPNPKTAKAKAPKAEEMPAKKTRKAESESDEEMPKIRKSKSAKVSSGGKEEMPKTPKPKAEPKRKLPESESELPVAKPKVRAEPKAVNKFVPVMRTAKEKEERAEKMELELMAESFKEGSPLKKKTSVKNK